jgi:hypothetical protein
MEPVVHMGEMKNAYLILVGKPPEKDMCEVNYMVTFTVLFQETYYEVYYLLGYDARAGRSARL